MNVLPAPLQLRNGSAELRIGAPAFAIDARPFALRAAPRVLVGIRPEAFFPVTPREARLRGEIEIVEMLGKEKILYVKGDWPESLLVVAKPDLRSRAGDAIALGFRDEDVHLFDAETERSLRT